MFAGNNGMQEIGKLCDNLNTLIVSHPWPLSDFIVKIKNLRTIKIQDFRKPKLAIVRKIKSHTN